MRAAINFFYINNIPRNAASSGSISRELPGSNIDQGRAIITNVSLKFTQSLEESSGVTGHYRNLPHSLQLIIN
jgi:hypothetical protein